METTNSTPTGASVDPVDQIAQLLAGDVMQTEEPENDLDVEEAAGPSEPSSEGVEGDEGHSAQDQELTWASALGIDEHQTVLDDEGNLKGIQVKVDGKVDVVPLQDLIAGYQTNKHVTQKSQALAEEKRQFDQIAQTASAQFIDKLQTVDRLAQVLQQSLLKEFNGIDWNAVRAQNPGEYAALMADYQTRHGQIQQLMTAIGQERQEMEAQQRGEYTQRYQQHLQAQYERTLANNPAWADPAVMQREVGNLADFVTRTYGYAPEEFAQVNDARHIELIKDAMAYRQGRALAAEKLQKAPPPKFVQGGKTTKPMSKLTQLTLSARKAKGAQKRDLQSAAVAELLMGNV